MLDNNEFGNPEYRMAVYATRYMTQQIQYLKKEIKNVNPDFPNYYAIEQLELYKKELKRMVNILENTETGR